MYLIYSFFTSLIGTFFLSHFKNYFNLLKQTYISLPHPLVYVHFRSSPLTYTLCGIPLSIKEDDTIQGKLNNSLRGG